MTATVVFYTGHSTITRYLVDPTDREIEDLMIRYGATRAEVKP